MIAQMKVLGKKSWYTEINKIATPSYHKIENGIPIKLTKEQNRYVQPASNKHQRLQGVAFTEKH